MARYPKGPRRMVRKIPGAARDMLRRRSGDYTTREWALALDVHVETIREHCRRDGVKCRPAPFRMHSFEEIRRRDARVLELRRLISAAVARRPDPPPRNADLKRMTPTAKRESARLTYATQQGVSPLLFRMTRMPLRAPE